MRLSVRLERLARCLAFVQVHVVTWVIMVNGLAHVEHRALLAVTLMYMACDVGSDLAWLEDPSF